jgi:eukaryotic-like serine/threonine-protein kinase
MANGTAQSDSALTAYRVLRELGTRSPCTFAAARQDGSLVVLQRFTRHVLADAELVSAEEMAVLLRDARCLAKNWHPNVARVRHVELDGGELDIATELVDGVTFEELLALAAARRQHPEEPVLSHAIVARIFLDVLAGLSALHSVRDGINTPLGAFHGALCPANIVIGKDGVARLVSVLRPRPVKVAALGSALGYASPETLAGEPHQDGRADIFSVGVMLWEALAERRLYEEDSAPRIAQRQREEDVATPAARLAEVAMRALAFDPAVRFRTAHEMSTSIRALAGTVAQGSIVAQTIAELAGDLIRARRIELEAHSSDHHAISSMRTRSRSRMAPGLDRAAVESADSLAHDTPANDAAGSTSDDALGASPAAPTASPSSPSLATMAAREIRVASVPDVDTSYMPRPKPARRATDAPPGPPSTQPALPAQARPVRSTPSSLPPACVEDDDDLPGPRQSTPDGGYLEQLTADLQGPRSSSSVLTTGELADDEDDASSDRAEEAAALGAAREVSVSPSSTTPPGPEPGPDASIPDIPRAAPAPSFPVAVAPRAALPPAPPSAPRREPSTRTPFVVDVMPDVRISSSDLGHDSGLDAGTRRRAQLVVLGGALVALALIVAALLVRSSQTEPMPAAATQPPPPSTVIVAPPPTAAPAAPVASSSDVPSSSAATRASAAPSPVAPRVLTPPKKRSVYDPSSY